jgi:hypothetical protein
MAVIWVTEHPSPDKRDSASESAALLLQSILPEDLWRGLDEGGVIRVIGKRWTYQIHRHGRTQIHDSASGRLVAYANFSLPIPGVYERIVVEYLLIRNAEDVFWRTADIVCRGERACALAIILSFSTQLVLTFHLLLEITGIGLS